MGEMNFIMQLQLFARDFVRDVVAASRQAREQLTQDAEVTVRIKSKGTKQAASDVGQVTTQVGLLAGAAEVADTNILELSEAGEKLKSRLGGSLERVNEIIRKTGGDTLLTRKAIENLIRAQKQAQTAAVQPAGEQQLIKQAQAVEIVKAAYDDLRLNLKALQEAFKMGVGSDFTEQTGISQLQQEVYEVAKIARQLGVGFNTDLEDNFQKNIETALGRMDKAQQKSIAKVQQQISAEESLVSKEKEQVQLTQEELALAAQVTAELKRQLQLRQQATEASRRAAVAGGGAGTAPGRPSAPVPDLSDQAGSVAIAMRDFQRIGRSSIAANPVVRSMHELGRDLQALDKSVRRLELLEFEASNLNPQNEGDAKVLAGLNQSMERLSRGILAQEDRFVSDLLRGSPAVQIPRLQRSQEGALEFARDAAGNVIKETVSQPQARRLMTEFFAQTLAEAFKTAQALAKRQAQDLGPENPRSEVLANFNFQDFIRGLEQGAPNAELVGKALEKAGLSAQQVTQQYAAGLVPLKQTEQSISEQTRRLRILESVEKIRGERARKLAGYYRAIRGLSYTIGGFAIGLTAGQKFREAFSGSTGLQQEIAGIQGVLPRRSPADAEFLRAGVSATARQYGADVIETAKAARIFAQTGLDANAVLKELNVTMLGFRGLGVTISQMQELQIAVRAVADEADRLDATTKVLDKIARVESQYAITASNIADAIKLAAPVVNQFAGEMIGLNDAIDLTIGLSTVMVEQLRITGNQAGNSLKFILARLARPEVLSKLQDNFGVRIGEAGSGGKRLLPLNDILKELVSTYRELDQAQRQQFAVLLAGGRRINAVLPILEDYEKVLEIANESSIGFGDAQARSAIQLNTLRSSVEQLSSSFTIFVDRLNQGTGLSRGLQGVANQLTRVFSLVDSSGGNAAATLALIFGASGAIGAIRGSFGALSDLTLASQIDLENGERATYADVRDARIVGRAEGRGVRGARLRGAGGIRGAFGRGAGALGRAVFSPTAVIAGVIVGLLALSGAILKARDEIDKFKVTPRGLAELGFFESGQFGELRNLTDRAGFQNTTQAVNAIQEAVLGDTKFRETLTGAGVESAKELRQRLRNEDGTLRTVQEIKDQFPNLREDLIAAFEGSLPEGFEHLFDDAETEAQRLAEITKFISLAALTVTAPLHQFAIDVQEAGKTLRSEVISNLQGAKVFDTDIGPLRQAIRTVINDFGAFGDPILRTKLETIRTPGPLGEDVVIRSKEIDFKGIEDSLVEAFGIIGKRLFAGVEGTDFRNRLHEVFQELAEETDTLGDVFIKLSERLSQDTDLSTAFDRRLEEGVEALILGERPDIAQLLGRSFDPVVAGRTTTQLNFQERVSGAVDRVIENILAEIEATGVDAHELDDAARVLSELAVNAEKVFLQDVDKALGGFRDKLVEFFLRVARELAQIHIDAQVAKATGGEFDQITRARDFGANLLGGILGLEADITQEIGKDLARRGNIETQQELQNAARQTVLATLQDEDGNLEGMVDLGAEAERLTSKIEAYRDQIGAFFHQGLALGDLLPDTPEIQALMSDLILLSRVFGTTAFDEDAYKATLATARGLVAAATEVLQTRFRDKLLLESNAQLERSRIAADTTRLDLLQRGSDKFAAELALKQELLKIELALLEAAANESGIVSLEEKNQLQERSVQLWLEQAEAVDQFVANAEVAFGSQIQENIRNSVQGVTAVLSDPSLFANITAGNEGAFRNLFTTLLEPLADTFTSRAAENLVASLAQAAGESSLLADVFGAPEDQMRNEMIAGGKIAADLVLQAHILGGRVIANQISASFASETLDAAGDTTTLSDKESIKNSLLLTGGNVLGGILGGISAKSSNKDTSAVNVGSGVGTGIGLLVSGGNPVGGAIGGAIGGFVGGFFGEEKEVEAQLRVLDAIHRAQVETIKTIESQTDALLNPANRFINLPSGFNVPGYNPGNGSTGVTYTFDFRGADFGGADAATTQATIETAIVDALNKSRQVSSRAQRNF